ncbi:MAG: hypothetical protein H8E55_66930 [Pelagibacterales bacterium]|nr:hypothetical protein [Pelagibacterales bacterium]
MKKLIISILLISSLFADTDIASLLMNHLYGNFDKETQSSTFSIDDVIDDCIITKEDKTNPNYEKHFNKKNIVTTYTHKIYGDILTIGGGSTLDDEKNIRGGIIFKSKFEGSLSFNDDGNQYHIVVVSMDRDYNRGFVTYDIIIAIENNSITTISPLKRLRLYPNRYSSSLRELDSIEFGKNRDGSSNVGFKIVYQMGISGDMIILYKIEQGEIKEILDISYNSDNTTFWSNCHLHYKYHPDISNIIYESLCNFYPKDVNLTSSEIYEYLYGDSTNFWEEWEGLEIIEFEGQNSMYSDVRAILSKGGYIEGQNKSFFDSFQNEMNRLTIPKYGTRLKSSSNESLIDREFHHTYDCPDLFTYGQPCDIISGSVEFDTISKNFNDMSIIYYDEILNVRNKKSFVYKNGIYNEVFDSK